MTALIKGKDLCIFKPVPASLLSKLSVIVGHSKSSSGYEEEDSEINWFWAWGFLGLPETFWFNDEDGETRDIPDEVREQLVGQKFARGMKFTFENKECYVIGFISTDKNIKIGKILTYADVVMFWEIQAVETRFIDMNS